MKKVATGKKQMDENPSDNVGSNPIFFTIFICLSSVTIVLKTKRTFAISNLVSKAIENILG